jgi:hypothetical protein
VGIQYTTVGKAWFHYRTLCGDRPHSRDCLSARKSESGRSLDACWPCWVFISSASSRTFPWDGGRVWF